MNSRRLRGFVNTALLLLSGCLEETADESREPLLTVAAADCGPNCPVVFERVGRLGASEDDVLPTMLSSAVRGGDGRFYVGPTDHPGKLAIYSGDGRLLRSFGSAATTHDGYGQLLELVCGPGDTISIMDVFLKRRTLIDSSGLPIRVHPIPYEHHSSATVGSRLFVQADVRDPGLIGYPVHELRLDGSILKSFAGTGQYRDPRTDGRRLITAAGDSGLWIAPPNRYEITYHDASQRPARTVRGVAAFFQSDSTRLTTGSGLTPSPLITDIWEDDGMLWVIIRRADLRQRSGSARRPEDSISLHTAITRYDWQLELIDVASGRLRASLRFDEFLFKGKGDAVLYGMMEDTAGGVTVVAYKPQYRKEGAR
jgi:hypothetical protein